MRKTSDRNYMSKWTTYDYVVGGFFLLVLAIIVYPLYWVIIASFSDPALVDAGKMWFLPKGFTLDGYKEIFTFSSLWIGYRNSLMYTVLGTAINLAVTITAGYVLSRKDLVGRSFLMVLFIIPMYFNGGLIPTYLQINSLGINNTIWAMVLPTALSVFNMIIARTYFQSNIPDELLECATLDGCGNFRFFFSIVLPLSTAILGVLTVYYAAGHWNGYFQALIYIRNKNLAPLQIILREILVLNSLNNESFTLMLMTNTGKLQRHQLAQLIKYGSIIVASVPLLILYPFMQRYFVKGVLIGSIKG